MPYDEKDQNEQWQNDLAKELNYLESFDTRNQKLSDAIRSMVARVAEFEEIREVDRSAIQ